MELTIQEINTLVEALKAWEIAPGRDGMIGSLLGMMVSAIKSKDEKESEIAFDKGNKRMDAAEIEVNRRRETSILLQAKLITMRNEAIARELHERLQHERI